MSYLVFGSDFCFLESCSHIFMKNVVMMWFNLFVDVCVVLPQSLQNTFQTHENAHFDLKVAFHFKKHENKKTITNKIWHGTVFLKTMGMFISLI